MTMKNALRTITLPWLAWAALAHSGPMAPSPPQGSASASASKAAAATERDEDRRRMEARAYAIGPVRRITLSSARFFDAEGKPCTAEPPPARVTERYVRNFLRQAIPISQVAVMNDYGSFGECTSDPVDVQFKDGRQVRLSFAADSGVGYLSPVVKGREEDVYFYYCEVCKR